MLTILLYFIVTFKWKIVSHTCIGKCDQLSLISYAKYYTQEIYYSKNKTKTIKQAFSFRMMK